MKNLKQKFEDKIDSSRLKVKQLISEYGDKVVGEISLRQIYSGMRGMLSMVTETSKLDPNEGIRFRGYSLPEIQDVLPRADMSNQPLPEGMFYLMLIGDLPTNEDVKLISSELERRSIVPNYVFDVITHKVFVGDCIPKISSGDIFLALGGPMIIKNLSNNSYKWLLCDLSNNY